MDAIAKKTKRQMAQVCRPRLGGGSIARTVGLCVGALGCAGLNAATGFAQDQPITTLRAFTNLVQMPTLVLDENRKPMAPVARFFVSVDGGPKFPVTHARLEGDDPISLAVVLDLSQPFPSLLPRFGDALAGLAPHSLYAHDHVSVYSMDCSLIRSTADIPAAAAALKLAVDIAMPPSPEHGRDRWKSQCKAPSNLFDSLRAVTEALSAQPGRRVILVVTDGQDRGSMITWNALRTFAQKKSVAIFGLVQPDTLWSVRARTGNFNAENGFDSLCELSGGIVMAATETSLPAQLRQFTTMLRGRYILEFPHPVDTTGGYHSVDIAIEKNQAFIRPTGLSVPIDDPALLKDPTTVPSDPSHAPVLGSRKVLSPN